MTTKGGWGRGGGGEEGGAYEFVLLAFTGRGIGGQARANPL